MDTQDDRPERPSPEDGKGMPPGWYPDPAGGWGLRHWSGAHWGDQVAAPVTPPAERTSLYLSVALVVELVVVVGTTPFFAFFTAMETDACPGIGPGEKSNSCYDLLGHIILALLVVPPALLVVCGAAFLWAIWKRRVDVKRLAVLVLGIGTVMTWVISLAMIGRGL